MFCEVQSWSKWEREKKRKKKKHLHPRSLSNSFSHMANIVLNLCYTQSEFSKICMGQMEAFLVFMPFWYSASWPSLVSRRVLLSYLQVSLFFLKVLVFHWSRHCCCGFDVSRGDGSESSPVSFHGSLKVDFEPVSVKLGLIATTGATHSTHTHMHVQGGGKTARFLTVVLLYAEEPPFFMADEAPWCDRERPFVWSFNFFSLSLLVSRGGSQICRECLMSVSVEWKTYWREWLFQGHVRITNWCVTVREW